MAEAEARAQLEELKQKMMNSRQLLKQVTPHDVGLAWWSAPRDRPLL